MSSKIYFVPLIRGAFSQAIRCSTSDVSRIQRLSSFDGDRSLPEVRGPPQRGPRRENSRAALLVIDRSSGPPMERHYFSGPLEIGRVSAFVAHVPSWWTLPGRYRFETKKDRYITQTERGEESKGGVDKEEEHGGKGCNGEDKDGE